MLTQHSPHMMDGHLSQRLGQQGRGPGRVPGRRRLRHQVEDAVLGFFIIPFRLTGPRRILQAAQAVVGKARSPLAHSGRAQTQPLGDRIGRLTGGGRQDDARTQSEPLFAGSRPRPELQGGPILFRQRNGGSFSGHNPNKRYNDN